MTGLLQDIQLAVRGIRRSPAPSLAIVLTLALGIGPLTAVFSAVYGVLLRPLPYADASRLVRLRQPATDGGPPINFNIPELADLGQRAASLESLVEYHTLWFNLIREREPQRVQTGVVSWNYFDVLGIRPLHGRTFREADDVVGAPRVLVLSYEYWMRDFGGDPDAVGRIVQMNQQPHEIVGVLPRIPRYPNSQDEVYMPGSACPFRTPGWLNNRQARALQVFGRIREHVPPSRTAAELHSAAQSLQRDFPESYQPGRSFDITATPLLEELTRGARGTLITLAVTAALVLLIVCFNVANLTLARILGRERDLALMTALGASRGIIARRVISESMVLALAGSAVGIALAAALTGPLARFAGRFSPRGGDITIDAPVLLFAVLAATGAGLVVGLLPVLQWRRNPAQALREGGTRSSSGGIRARAVLVVGQVALSCVLLIGAGLLVRSLGRLQSVDSGFQPAQVLTMRIDLDFSRYTAVGRARAGVTDSGPQPIQFWNRLLDELTTVPAVQAGALASNVPLNGGLPQLQFRVRGREGAGGAAVNWNVISDGYLQASGVTLLQGRDFSSGDRQATPQVALVSQQLARQFWGDANPIGSAISPGGPNPNWFEVVGVVSDVRQDGLNADPVPQAYLSIRQVSALGSTLLVRTAGDALAAEPVVREAVRRVDPFQPVAFVQTLEQVRRDSLAPSRQTAQLLGMFALLALGISAVGTAGVMAYVVGQRTREIGIRLALGANPAEVRGMVIRQTLRLVVAGLAIGVIAAVLLSRWLTGLLFQTSPLDPYTYGVVAALLIGVGLLAAFIPARRSARISPLTALQAE